MQSFPFDSELTYDEHDNPIYDRAVSSQPLRKLIKELFTTGVMPNPSTNLQVSAGNDGMTVQIAAGFAVIDGGLCHETETRTLEVTAADNTYDRIDTVVLRWNENVDVRNADLYVIAGTPAVNPVRPTLQRNNSIYEIGLADVFITKRVATITNDKITDTRYEAERCGVVSSISEFDTTTLYQQVQADLTGFKSTEQANFLTWYENIQNILDENAAGHLQNEIDELSGSVNRQVSEINNDLTDKVSGFTDATYSAVTGLAYDRATKKLGLKVGADTVIPFSRGAKLVGTYSSNATIDVSSYGATSASQFLAVPSSTKSISGYGSSTSWTSDLQELNLSGSYTPPSLSLNGNVLSVTPATISASSYLTELNNYQKPVRVSASSSTNLPTKVYYVGDIESA